MGCVLQKKPKPACVFFASFVLMTGAYLSKWLCGPSLLTSWVRNAKSDEEAVSLVRAGADLSNMDFNSCSEKMKECLTTIGFGGFPIIKLGDDEPEESPRAGSLPPQISAPASSAPPAKPLIGTQMGLPNGGVKPRVLPLEELPPDPVIRLPAAEDVPQNVPAEPADTFNERIKNVMAEFIGKYSDCFLDRRDVSYFTNIVSDYSHVEEFVEKNWDITCPSNDQKMSLVGFHLKCLHLAICSDPKNIEVIRERIKILIYLIQSVANHMKSDSLFLYEGDVLYPYEIELYQMKSVQNAKCGVLEIVRQIAEYPTQINPKIQANCDYFLRRFARAWGQEVDVELPFSVMGGSREFCRGIAGIQSLTKNEGTPFVRFVNNPKFERRVVGLIASFEGIFGQSRRNIHRLTQRRKEIEQIASSSLNKS